ncbi:DNA repair exonuclease [Pelomyxa schiedti]|nr:DNA repair exonuclease [Pelomyxa schiedti]
MEWIFSLCVGVVWLALGIFFVIWLSRKHYDIGKLPFGGTQLIPLAIVFWIFLTIILLCIWAGVWKLLKELNVIEWDSWIEEPYVTWTLLGIVVFGILCIPYSRLFEPKFLCIRHLRAAKGSRNLDFVGRIVVISDLHIDTVVTGAWKGLVSAVNGCKPDVVVLLGDLLNSDEALPILHNILSKIQATRKLAVRGNWDTWYWHTLPLLKDTGFQWLDGSCETIDIGGQTVHIVGCPFSDEETEPVGVANALLESVPAEDWRVFLYHSPDLCEEIVGADLLLSGHTHGGQFAVPFFGPLVALSRFNRKYARGLHRVSGRSSFIYINPGIGVEPMIPWRFCMRPEVTVIDLYQGTGSRVSVSEMWCSSGHNRLCCKAKCPGWMWRNLCCFTRWICAACGWDRTPCCLCACPCP